MRNVRISVTQFKLKPYRRFEGFKDSILNFLDKSTKSDYVVFGEWFTLGLLSTVTDSSKARYLDIKKVSKYTDDYIELFSKLAGERNQFIIGGTTVEHNNGRYYDTCFIFGPGGKIYKHRKTHLFPLERERWDLSEDSSMNVIKTEKARIGVCICYESQIPECARNLALKGAEIIFCPSFTITKAGYNRIRHACEARAIENQLIVIMSSVVGRLPKMAFRGLGKSSILSPCDNPWPDSGIVAEGSMNKEMVLYSEINLDDIYRTRTRGAARPHRDRIRRSELYRKWY